MVLQNTTAQESLPIFEQFRRSIEERDFEYEGKKLKVTVSIGLAQTGIHSNDPRVLFNHSDDALYDCKRNGRNQVRISKAEQEPDQSGDKAG
jgi:diguanylate cyclase (GGDEF)-like protein